MNRISALNVIFDDEEAGNISSDELSDYCEEASDFEDEIDYEELETDIIEALAIEQDLLAPCNSTETPLECITPIEPVSKEQPKRKRGRPPKNNPKSKTSNKTGKKCIDIYRVYS
jgi:hypothetical protein